MLKRIAWLSPVIATFAALAISAQPMTRPSATTKPGAAAAVERAAAASATTKPANMVKTPEGLVIITTAPGESGCQDGDLVWVHYTGKLKDGKKFDSSRDSGKPIQFVLGEGSVIKGWEIGIRGMKVGEKRTLIIPPALGYGAQGKPPIPPNAELHFDVELMGFVHDPDLGK